MQAPYARTRVRAHTKNTLKCMMYIELYVFGDKIAISDIIFFVRAPWERKRTRARTKKIKMHDVYLIICFSSSLPPRPSIPEFERPKKLGN